MGRPAPGLPEDDGKGMMVMEAGLLSQPLPIVLITDSIVPMTDSQRYGDLAGGQLSQCAFDDVRHLNSHASAC